jgi:hypothetical protein
VSTGCEEKEDERGYPVHEADYGNAFAETKGMSKENPNQDYYKTGGRSQSDGPDRMHADVNADKHKLAQTDLNRNADHPAVRRSKKK